MCVKVFSTLLEHRRFRMMSLFFPFKHLNFAFAVTTQSFHVAFTHMSPDLNVSRNIHASLLSSTFLPLNTFDFAFNKAREIERVKCIAPLNYARTCKRHAIAHIVITCLRKRNVSINMITMLSIVDYDY